jgi:hypothetical protein
LNVHNILAIQSLLYGCEIRAFKQRNIKVKGRGTGKGARDKWEDLGVDG